MQEASIGDLKHMVNTDVKGHLNAKRQLTRHLDLSTDIYEKKKANDFKIQLEMEVGILHSQNFDEIVSYIHTMICRCEPNKYRPLQLLCLLSTANNGLPREYYELLCRSFLQSYGYEHIPLLYKLEQLSLFYVKRQCDVPLAINSNAPAGFRGEAILKMGKQVAQNLTDKTQTQKTFFQFMRKRLNLAPDLNQPAKTVPGPDMVWNDLPSIQEHRRHDFLLLGRCIRFDLRSLIVPTDRRGSHQPSQSVHLSTRTQSAWLSRRRRPVLSTLNGSVHA